ncbi:MAG: hypothetical protein ACT4PX_12250 [Actinomycetota bacterium]
MATDIHQPAVPLSNGSTMPLVGLGTWEMTGSECYRAVRCALDLGYRHGHVDHGVIVIPKSATPERIAANFDVFGFSLDDEELRRVDALSEAARW